jgi:hypothetical protein
MSIVCILPRRFVKIKLPSKTIWKFWIHLKYKIISEFFNANCVKLEKSFEEPGSFIIILK